MTIKMKTITVKDETHARLRKAGISGESMDVIINRLLDLVDEHDKMRDSWDLRFGKKEGE